MRNGRVPDRHRRLVDARAKLGYFPNNFSVIVRITDAWLFSRGTGGPVGLVGIPGIPLPPGQVKNWIDDLIPNFGKGKGQWK